MKSEIEKIRALFPVTKSLIYFNHAGTGPISIPAQQAIQECLSVYSRQAEFDLDKYFERVRSRRAIVARLIGADPEEITFTHNTSQGILIALTNLPLQPGDKILIMEEVFPAVRYIVDYNLPSFEKLYVSFCGKDSVEVVKNNLDRKVKAVVIDYAQYLSGEMIDLERLSRFLREREIFLVVDAIQAIGAVDFNVRKTEVDYLACGSAKWLFGPSGAGFLFVNKRNFGSLKRFHTGWLGAQWYDFEDCQKRPALYRDARMFELGTRNVMGISAFSENIKILLEYGLENIEVRISALKSLLRDHFGELKYRIITPENSPQSGIITIRPDNARSLYDLLLANKITVSLRSNCLRFSPHFYNTEQEVEKIFEVLKRKTVSSV